MLSVRALAVWLVALVAVIGTACTDPPDREMQQAQGAIDAARAAGADEYAAQELEAARQALSSSEAAVEAGDYRLALNHAVDSRDRAQQAARQAADGKAVARVAADRAITGLGDALAAAQAATASAESARVQARVVSAAQDALAHADGQLQEARTAFDAGDYTRVVALAEAARPGLAATMADVQAALAAAPRRGR